MGNDNTQESFDYQKEIDDLRQFGKISDDLNNVLNNFTSINKLDWETLYKIVYINYTIEQFLNEGIQNDIVKSRLSEENLRLTAIIKLIDDDTYKKLLENIKNTKDHNFDGLKISCKKERNITKLYFEKIFKSFIIFLIFFVVFNYLVMIGYNYGINKIDNYNISATKKNKEITKYNKKVKAKKSKTDDAKSKNIKDLDSEKSIYVDGVNSLLHIVCRIFIICMAFVICWGILELIMAFVNEEGPEERTRAIMTMSTGFISISGITMINELFISNTDYSHTEKLIKLLSNEQIHHYKNIVCQVGRGLIGMSFILTFILIVLNIINIIWLNKMKDEKIKKYKFYIFNSTKVVLNIYQSHKLESIIKANLKSNKIEILDQIAKNIRDIKDLHELCNIYNPEIWSDILKICYKLKSKKDNKSTLYNYVALEYYFNKLSKEQQYEIIHIDVVKSQLGVAH